MVLCSFLVLNVVSCDGSRHWDESEVLKHLYMVKVAFLRSAMIDRNTHYMWSTHKGLYVANM